MLQEEVAAYWRHHAGEYAEGDNSDVVWEALLVIAEQTPELFRDAVEAAAAAVGARCCTHVSIPGPLADTGSLGERRTAAQQHAGLCGKYHAEHIANIDLATIEERAGGAAISTKKMRNQACYDAGTALNARGRGVQLTRQECFTQACRAVWPDDQPLPAAVVAALSSM